jgi:ABC-type enterochelin transport system substrate-binding protein
MEDIKMAVSIAELIEQKEKLALKKKQQYDITTSVGTLTIKLPTRAYVTDVKKLDNPDELLILECVKAPNLKDPELLKAYECMEPTDVVIKLFEPGEIPAISNKIIELAGYGKDIHAELNQEAKN